MFNTLAPIDTLRPVVTEHPLARGLLAWWAGLPGMFGGAVFGDALVQSSLPQSGPASWTRLANFGAANLVGGYFGAANQSRLVFPAGSAMSYFTWFNAASLGTYTALVNCRGNNGNHIGFSFYASNASNKLAVYIFDGAGGLKSIDGSGTAIATGVDYFAGVTYDQSTITLWLNGAVYASNSVGAFGWYTRSQDTFCLGNDTSASGRSFFGRHGGGLLYSRALSAGEVAQLYAEGRTGYPTLLRRRPSVVYFLPQATVKGRRTLYHRVGSRGVA